MRESPFTESRLRVRYSETDQMGVVYHANYLVWFEIGRTEFCRQQGVNYHHLEREQDLFLAVTEARCRYLHPARYDDEIIVRTGLLQVRRRALKFSYQAIRAVDIVLLAEAETAHIVLNAAGRPSTLPSHVVELLKG